MTLKSAVLFGLLLWQGVQADERPVARPDSMRYEREIRVPHGLGQACAALDAQVFPHAAPSLKDVRVFQTANGKAGAREVPFVITLSETAAEETQAARVLNLGSAGANIVFDLEMPDRAYTDVSLDLEGQDFLATAKVLGANSLTGGKWTALGIYTLFDLQSQHLSRDTTLPLQESTFRYLHIILSVSPAPGASQAGAARFRPTMVEGAQVPPSREAQTLYTTVAETTSVTNVGRESRATFVVPARVPVERVSFVLGPEFRANFSRDVRIVATPGTPGHSTDGTSTPKRTTDEENSDETVGPPETVTGNILRVYSTQGGREIHTEQLSVPAILGANLQRAAKVEVDLENGDDQPLPITAVRLEMRQRTLCFEAPSKVVDVPASAVAVPASDAAAFALYYGDPALFAPVYDYERLFTPSEKPLAAELGPETINPIFHPPPAEVRPFIERHPEVLWIALIAVISALGIVALKSSRNVGR